MLQIEPDHGWTKYDESFNLTTHVLIALEQTSEARIPVYPADSIQWEFVLRVRGVSLVVKYVSVTPFANRHLASYLQIWA